MATRSDNARVGFVEFAFLAAVLGAVGYSGWLVLVRVRAGERASAQALEREREAKSLAGERARAVLERPGVLPTRPLAVSSAAAIEPRAQAEPCPSCGGRLHVDEHVVVHEAGRRLRRVSLRCGQCGGPSALFFELRPQAPS